MKTEVENSSSKRDKMEEVRDKIEVVFGGISSLLCVLAIFHAIQSRTAADFWKYSLSIAVVITAILLIFGAIVWFQERPKLSWLSIIVFLIGGPIGIAFMSVLYYAIGASIKDLFLWARSTDVLSFRAVVACVLVLAIGAILFYFRLRYRSVYGATEALVGVAVAMQRLLSTPANASPVSLDLFLPLLTASVYLVVRGLDNVHQGLTKEPLDPAAAAILTWIRSRSQ